MSKKKEKSIWRKFAERIYPRDVVAIPVLIWALYLISKGINHIVSGIAIMIVTYYFSKRLYEEREK